MKDLRPYLLVLILAFLPACQTLDALEDDMMHVADENLGVVHTITGSQSEYILENNPCPQVEIVDDLSSLSDFTDPQRPFKNNLISRIDLRSAESACKLGNKSVIVDLKLVFDGKLGSNGRKKPTDKPFFSYPFFVAVTSPTGKIMAKEIFAASMTYSEGNGEHSYYENLRQIIPVRSKLQAKRHKILIGFQVTADQLAYNRANMVMLDPPKPKPKTNM